MFEISVALKYLIPRWRQLSVSIISTISVLVIALVVWLILVFFSVTDGLEKGWVEKLTSITAPIRIAPTESYYNSYYYQVDSISESSNYTHLSIGEKRDLAVADPYNPQQDESLPSSWPEADRAPNGELRDLVNEAFESIEVAGKSTGNDLVPTDYETTYANLRFKLLRETVNSSNGRKQVMETTLSQASYLNSFDPSNPTLSKAIVEPTADDIRNLLNLHSISNSSDEIISHIHIDSVKLPSQGLRVNLYDLPKETPLNVVTLYYGKRIRKVLIPLSDYDEEQIYQQLSTRGYTVRRGTLSYDGSAVGSLHNEGDNAASPLSVYTPLLLSGSKTVKTTTTSPQNLSLPLQVQGQDIPLTVKWDAVEIVDGHLDNTFDSQPPCALPWLYHLAEDKHPTLDRRMTDGEPVLLAKNYRDHGVLIGDQGVISYYSPSMSSTQEQKIPIFVAGFFDPGVIPVGGRFVTLDKEITSLIRSTQPAEDKAFGNGIYVRFKDTSEAENVKAAIVKELKRRRIDRYWNVETYHEYDFTKELLLQLKSERNLFTVISLIIILVACSNIISMLIILINDKKVEIGILRSMGASSRSIAAIFGICGTVMGLMGSVIGIVIACITLKNLNTLISFISAIQGHAMFNATFYGEFLPEEVSTSAFLFVLSSTVVISLISGVIPAVKASRMQPASILRSE